MLYCCALYMATRSLCPFSGNFILFILRYQKIGKFVPEAIICKMFYAALFVILFMRIIIFIFLAIFSGILVIYYIKDSEGISAKRSASSVYVASIYMTDGLFIAATLLLFWVLRSVYKRGQVSETEQIMLLNRGN